MSPVSYGGVSRREMLAFFYFGPCGHETGLLNGPALLEVGFYMSKSYSTQLKCCSKSFK